MAEDKPAAPEANAAQDPKNIPSLNIVSQYIRDLSFENPEAPDSVMGGVSAPSFNVNINVAVKKQSDDIYAVELTLNAKASRDEKLLFNVELIYGGLFRVLNIPENQMAPALMIECPRLIFPFARQVLATVTQAGGFPPLLMEPVDFAVIYRQNLVRMAEAAKQAGAAPGDVIKAENGAAKSGKKDDPKTVN